MGLQVSKARNYLRYFTASCFSLFLARSLFFLQSFGASCTECSIFTVLIVLLTFVVYVCNELAENHAIRSLRCLYEVLRTHALKKTFHIATDSGVLTFGDDEPKGQQREDLLSLTLRDTWENFFQFWGTTGDSS